MAFRRLAEADGQVTDYFRWLAHTHAMRWRVARRTVGYGHLYQGRFKSFPAESDTHLLTVARYVERTLRPEGRPSKNN
jgi:putative transposase